MKKKVDISKHILVPKHFKASEREKQELLKKYTISLEEIPRISENDAAIADLNVKLGDIIKIKRPSATAKEAIFFRVVFDG